MTNLDRILYEVTKPARYTGGEWNSVVKDWDKAGVRVVLTYPDTYEIGMSTLAIHLLYELINAQEGTLCERVFAPWPDMAARLRAGGLPLMSLESKRPIKDFDLFGFSLGYELTYTNVLNMLDLARIPLASAERDDSHPIIIAGGSAALNPEPMADFVDAFVLGDGEEAVPEILSACRDWKREGAPRSERLKHLAGIPGVYVPAFYQAEYDGEGRFRSLSPLTAEAKPTIRRRIIAKLPPLPVRLIVPFTEIIHDRAAIEIQRGCSSGCRFCQAGTIYRPVRERPQEEVVSGVGEIMANTGYNEISLVSLSTCDYAGINELVARLFARYHDKNLIISLPSLRADSFSIKLLDQLAAHKRTGLTFAPEAGSERLRQAINKNATEPAILEAAAEAFARGWTGIKLYFMLGLPTETPEDAAAIADLINKVSDAGRKSEGRRPQIRVTLATFVPKPHTPFQWFAQETEARLGERLEVLKQGLKRRDVKLSWSDPRVSLLEAALSRGDRRLGQVIRRAWELGSVFDSWNEYFSYENWVRAFSDSGLVPDFYARRQLALDEPLPWGHIDIGLSPAFFKREYQKAQEGKRTPDCRRQACNACGLESSEPACREKLSRA